MTTTTDKRPLLLAIDGEAHTAEAVEWTLGRATRDGLRVVAVHVKDPYLKQFYNEIYAQGREEYLDHVEVCLEEVAAKAREDFKVAAESFCVEWEVRTESGNPVEVIKKQIEAGDYQAVVTGKKVRSGLDSLRTPDLPSLLLRASLEVHILSIPPGGEKTHSR